MNTFKIGDKVIVKEDNCNHRYKIGRILTIQKIAPNVFYTIIITVKEGINVLVYNDIKKQNKKPIIGIWA